MLFSYSEANIKDYYNRDDFGKCEHLVTKHHDELVEYNLSKDRHVILDATHLKLKYINQIKKKFYYSDIEFIDVAKKQGLSVMNLRTVCIERDSNRTRQVGELVITKQIRDYQQLLKNFDFKPYKANIEPIVQDEFLPKAVIFDVDGTLTERVDRSPYDWSKVEEDLCNNYVANTFDAYDYKGYCVIICTGRDGCCEEKTKKWLYDNNIIYDEFYIRPESNTEPDYVIKERMWRDIANRYYIEALYDDRHQVISHGVRLGLNMINVKGIKQDF